MAFDMLCFVYYFLADGKVFCIERERNMLESLFYNFTILTTFLFFGNIVWGIWQQKYPKKEWETEVLLGFILGVFGIILMYSGFYSGQTAYVDFRQLPILVSVYMGGWLSGLISAVMILIYRLFFLNGLHLASILGAVNILITFLFSILLIQRRKLSLLRWGWALACSACSSVILIYVIFQEKLWITIGMFTPLYLISGLFTFMMLQYLRKSDDSLRIMREAANRDFLTGLSNLRAFEFMMEQKILSSKRYNTPFSLVMIDIDHFKKVNDTYGHSAGDAVLAQLADVLRDTFRPGDHIARKGGEEFAVIVDHCAADKVLGIAERLRQNVESNRFFLPDGTELKMTISAGSATYPDVPEHDLIDKADQALYRAKSEGRNRVC